MRTAAAAHAPPAAGAADLSPVGPAARFHVDDTRNPETGHPKNGPPAATKRNPAERSAERRDPLAQGRRTLKGGELSVPVVLRVRQCVA
jgi:hypothetical protein